MNEEEKEEFARNIEARTLKAIKAYMYEAEEKEREDEKKNEIKVITAEFTSTTTAHGVSRIGDAATFGTKLLWWTIFLAAFSLFAFQAYSLIMMYFDYPVVVKIKVVDTKHMAFPSVTICNNNRLKRSSLTGTHYSSLYDIDVTSRENIEKMLNTTVEAISRKDLEALIRRVAMLHNKTAHILPKTSPGNDSDAGLTSTGQGTCDDLSTTPCMSTDTRRKRDVSGSSNYDNAEDADYFDRYEPYKRLSADFVRDPYDGTYPSSTVRLWKGTLLQDGDNEDEEDMYFRNGSLTWLEPNENQLIIGAVPVMSATHSYESIRRSERSTSQDEKNMLTLTPDNASGYNESWKLCASMGKQLCTLRQLRSAHRSGYRNAKWGYFSKEGRKAMVSEDCRDSVDLCEECYDDALMTKTMDEKESLPAYCCKQTFMITDEEYNSYEQAALGCKQRELRLCSMEVMKQAHRDGFRNEAWGWFVRDDKQISLTERCNVSRLVPRNRTVCNTTLVYICSNETEIAPTATSEPTTPEPTPTPVYCNETDFECMGCNVTEEVNCYVIDYFEAVPADCHGDTIPMIPIEMQAHAYCCDYSTCARSPCSSPWPGCSSPLGLENSRIMDMYITASSAEPSFPAYHARLNSRNAWTSKSSDPSPWLKVDLRRRMMVTGIITQGFESSFAKSFRFQYSRDGSEWWMYKEYHGENMLICGNHDDKSYNHQHFERPFVARYVKVMPVSWNVLPRMRIELLGCDKIECNISRAYQREEFPDPSGLQCLGEECMTSVSSYRGALSQSATLTCGAWKCPNRHPDMCLEENYCRPFTGHGDTRLACPWNSAAPLSDTSLSGDDALMPCSAIDICRINEGDKDTAQPTKRLFYHHQHALQYCEEREMHLCTIQQLTFMHVSGKRTKRWGWFEAEGKEVVLSEGCGKYVGENCYQGLFPIVPTTAISRPAYCCRPTFSVTEKKYEMQRDARKNCNKMGLQLCTVGQLRAAHRAGYRLHGGASSNLEEKQPKKAAWYSKPNGLGLIEEDCGCRKGRECYQSVVITLLNEKKRPSKAMCCEKTVLLTETQHYEFENASLDCARHGMQLCELPQLSQAHQDGHRDRSFGWYFDKTRAASLPKHCNNTKYECIEKVTLAPVTSVLPAGAYCCSPPLKRVVNESGPYVSQCYTYFPTCNNPIGMENGNIPDHQIKASSYKPEFGAHKSRLNLKGAWISESSIPGKEWLQLDMGEIRIVTAVLTQGLGSEGSWVETYSLSFSINAVKWWLYKNATTNEVVIFKGNDDGEEIQHQHLPRAVVSRYVRFYPTRFVNNMALRVELVGCTLDECDIKQDIKGVKLFNQGSLVCKTYECINGDGHTYRGTKNVTMNGLPCQLWNTDDPYPHCYSQTKYPHRCLVHNYCRNLLDDPTPRPRPWCYTSEESEKGWEFCEIEQCELARNNLGFIGVEGEGDWAGFISNSFTDDYSDISDISTASREEIDELGHQKEDFVLQCTFDKRRCKLRELHKFQNSKFGNCYTFNPGMGIQDEISTMKSGARYGLKMTLFVEKNEYVGIFGQEPGATVTIHPVNMTPFPEDHGLILRPGESTFIGIRKKVVQRLQYPYGDDCILSTEEFDSLYGGSYSFLSCQKTCLQRAILDKCECTDELVTGSNSGICSVLNSTQERCRRSQRQLFDDDKIRCNCKQSCRDEVYNIWMSSSTWPSDNYLPYVLQNIHSRTRAKNLPRTAEEVKQNLVRLHVYFQELTFEEIREHEGYLFEELLSGIGGLLGLYIGISVITVFEVLQFGCEILRALFRKWRRSKVADRVKKKTVAKDEDYHPSAIFYDVGDKPMAYTEPYRPTKEYFL
ncbi:uncharacterized protein LOC144906232 [Branchiostoma floridae x Branchiostoma belcheri]